LVLLDEHEIYMEFGGWEGQIETDCGVVIALPDSETVMEDLVAWAEAALERYRRFPNRLLSTCPGCRPWGHRWCPM
jgi:hypothetical protein